MPAAARLLARKQLRRRAATEGNGKVSCADGTRGEVRGCVHLRRRAEIGGAVGSREEERAGWRLLVVRPAATESERAGAASYSRVRKGAASVGDRSGLGARWCSPSKEALGTMVEPSHKERGMSRAHVVPGVPCVQDQQDGVLYPTPPLSARRVIEPTVHSVREYSPEQTRLPTPFAAWLTTGARAHLVAVGAWRWPPGGCLTGIRCSFDESITVPGSAGACSLSDCSCRRSRCSLPRLCSHRSSCEAAAAIADRYQESPTGPKRK